MSRADEEDTAVVTLCSVCGKPLSGKDIDCPTCGSVDRPSTGPAGDASVVVTSSAKAVPGRILTGTVVSIGGTRQEPVVSKAVPVVCRVAAAAALVALAGSVLVGKTPPSSGTTIFALFCLLLLTGLGFALRGATAKANSTSGSARSPLLLSAQVASDEHPGVRKVLRAIGRVLLQPLRAVLRGPAVVVVPLSVKEVSGVSTRCDVRGAVRGGMPVQGDVVEVYGRRVREGTVLVRQFVDTSDGGSKPVRLPTACAVVRVTSAAIACTWTFAAFGITVLLVFGR
ncbi:hypothetical protein [Umezawaea sp. NPDC059074]|uniref:hypothetical protein n=1 Tax=Umezawaea sp. NPDC059074 TaxID=3346716 RepID=UPI0036C26DD2